MHRQDLPGQQATIPHCCVHPRQASTGGPRTKLQEQEQERGRKTAMWDEEKWEGDVGGGSQPWVGEEDAHTLVSLGGVRKWVTVENIIVNN